MTKDERIVVLFIDHSDDFAGGQKSLVAFLQQVDRNRFLPIVLLDQNASLMRKHISQLGIQVISINFYNRGMAQFLMLPLVLWRTFFAARSVNCRILHCNTFKAGLIGSIISFFPGMKFVFRARLGIVVRSHGFIDWLIFKRAILILANSNYVKETFEIRFGGSKKIEVVYNPMFPKFSIDPEVTARLRAQFFQPGVFHFGAIGRVERAKNLHDLIEAVRLVKVSRPFRVLIIGAGSKLERQDYPAELARLIDQFGLGDRIIFTGFISEILEMTTLLDAVTLGSVGEALSRGIFESQFLGVPVIASNSGGNVETVIHEQTGLLFEPGDPKDLASQMSRLMEDAALYETIRKQAASYVSDLFAPMNTFEKEMRLLEKLG